jgi:flavin reductase (DIM6/NTAB) family NADH-FMN oxidoreductase RutF
MTAARSSFAFKKNWWPAPVTLISCGVNPPGTKDGANIWVVGVLGGPNDDPPLLTISPRTTMFSYHLMDAHKQFVVNIPSVDMVREMEYCGTHSGIEADKWTVCGFTPIRGDVVDVPLIAECPVNYECVVERQLSFDREDGSPGEHEIMIGRIVRVHAHDSCLVNGELQWDLVDTIYRARPRTWRAMGPVLGYDERKQPLAKPELATELVDERTRSLGALREALRDTPYPTQTSAD